jgi:hypothetical protein
LNSDVCGVRIENGAATGMYHMTNPYCGAAFFGMKLQVFVVFRTLHCKQGIPAEYRIT